MQLRQELPPRVWKKVTLVDATSQHGIYKKEEIFERASDGKTTRVAMAYHINSSSNLAQIYAEGTMPQTLPKSANNAERLAELARIESAHRNDFWAQAHYSDDVYRSSAYLPYGKYEKGKGSNNFMAPWKQIFRCPMSSKQLSERIKKVLDFNGKFEKHFETEKAQVYLKFTRKAPHTDPRPGKLNGTPFVKMLTKLGGNIVVLDEVIKCSACTIVLFDSNKLHEVKAVETIGVTLHHQAHDRRFERFLASKDDDEFRASVEVYANTLITHLLKFEGANTPRKWDVPEVRLHAFKFPLLATAAHGIDQCKNTEVLRLAARENKAGFTCIHCKQQFQGKAAKEHRREHPNPTGWKCTTNLECNTAHKTVREYRACNREKLRNKRIHTGEKSFKCKFEGCNAAFAKSSHLKTHHRIHTGEKPFKCEFEGCNAAFASSGDLTGHHRIHTGEKPFKCRFEGCNAAFAKSSNLTRHHRIHTKEKPFKCQFEGCNAAFAQSYNLKTHYKSKKHSGREPAHKRGEPDPKRRKH